LAYKTKINFMMGNIPQLICQIKTASKKLGLWDINLIAVVWTPNTVPPSRVLRMEPVLHTAMGDQAKTFP